MEKRTNKPKNPRRRQDLSHYQQFRAAIRNEISKMVWRPAFMVLTGLMLLAGGSMYGNKWWKARSSPEAGFALPEAWPEILGSQLARPGLIFGSLLILLLVASEYSWRTARQNVIDGLSKTAWFRGKIGVLLLVGILFLFLQAGMGIAFAAAGTESWSPEILFPGIQGLTAMGKILLAYLGYGSLALLVALTVRSPGPAVGVWFLYAAAGERLLATLLEVFNSPQIDAALRFLPVNLFNSLLGYGSQNPVGVTVSACWIVFFIGVGFIMHRNRDL